MAYVLITGSNGFIGGKLTKQILDKGHKVLGLSTGESSIIEHENLRYIKADLTDCISVEKIFSEYDITSVIHLAAIAHLKNRKKIDWNEFFRVNTLASKTIFKCAIKANAKLFYASTVDVYGNANVPIISENCERKPVSDYAKSKLIAENVLKEMAVRYSYENYAIGRFAPVYAKGYMKDAYKRIYLKYPNLAFIVGNENNYHFVSVNNVVDFITEWLESNKEIAGIFNICDSQPISSLEFINLEKKIGNAKKVFRLPNLLLTTIKILLEVSYKVTRNRKLNKINMNFYKLITPAKYSTKKMEEVIKPKWNLKDTVYKESNNVY